MQFVKEHFVKIVIVVSLVIVGLFLFFKGIHVHVTSDTPQGKPRGFCLVY